MVLNHELFWLFNMYLCIYLEYVQMCIPMFILCLVPTVRVWLVGTRSIDIDCPTTFVITIVMNIYLTYLNHKTIEHTQYQKQ